MFKAGFILYHLLILAELLRADEDVTAIAPQDCSLKCIQQGEPGCEYCRITREHIQEVASLNTIKAFGSCIPRPCFELFGNEDPGICQHYVQAPKDVTVEFVPDQNPKSDTIVASWKPSYYGIAFLRGFQVTLQALGGSNVDCQLFLFHRNLSLPASHTDRVYKSDPFPGLSLDSQYVVRVMALPVPEEWKGFYNSKIFSTRTCAEKNGLEHCKRDWYPQYIKVTQEAASITVTFNLAPPNMGIRSYFSLCYANSMNKYKDIIPDFSKNKTHHSFQLSDLQEETNYTCQIAANEMDAVRKTFHVYVKRIQKESALPFSATPSLALILPLSLFLVAIIAVLGAVLMRTRAKLKMKKLFIEPVPALMEGQNHQDSATEEEEVSLHRNRLTPPRLLICYSSFDGPAHVKAVMQLGAFIQQHMATQVVLDLWDTLSVATEGNMAWHCRQIQQCDFILVICSQGISHKPEPQEPGGDNEDEEADRTLACELNAFTSNAVVQLIREEVGRAKGRGQDLSKYMAAIFEYSEITDIPNELRLVSQYMLTTDLALLFSHLHGVALHRPGGYLRINHISAEGFTKLPAGAALQHAICEARMAVRGRIHQSVD